MWGDSLFSVEQLLQVQDLDYLLLEGLAEITMGILSRMKDKSEELGYAVDFFDPILKNSLSTIVNKKVKIITNAGGVNPLGAAKRLREICKEQNIDLKIAAITGDDVYHRLEEFRSAGLTDSDKQRSLPSSNILSMNAYLGAFPIAQALRDGADVVITGRCADSALALGPLIYEFDWKPNQLDLLAQGSLAGHLLECGAQVTGGLMTDWNTFSSWENMGYPVADCKENGDFVVTKLKGTDGLVNTTTVSEQLIYEIGDPAAYLLPDVVCDFTQVKLTEVEKDSVLVQGALGNKPTPTYKAIAQTVDGYKAVYVFMITGRDLIAKANRLMKDTRERIEKILEAMGFSKFINFSVELLGSESNFGENSRIKNPRELIIKLAVHHSEKKAINILSRELPSLAVSTIQSFCTGITGRVSPSPLLRPLSYLIDKKKVDEKVKINFDGQIQDFKIDLNPEWEVQSLNKGDLVLNQLVKEGTTEVSLYNLAYARSGDKGNTANIGVIARAPDFFEYLEKNLSPEMLKHYFKHFVKGEVYRYKLEGIGAFNFLMFDALGGGGAASLRFDSQGKGLGQNLLEMKMHVPTSFLSHPEFKKDNE
jgi:hypothetical protein